MFGLVFLVLFGLVALVVGLEVLLVAWFGIEGEVPEGETALLITGAALLSEAPHEKKELTPPALPLAPPALLFKTLLGYLPRGGCCVATEVS